ncbi:hypothetical protein NDU88_000496 [Pleurodeles waltl]|uniref:Uncharacterized protein n=1 Tax=Pleurodeles waltl TaxID=8319 RepID=A0AAV7UQ60_PLEWA|nr:hypothetical protein NDU88_000496 [Pleurodeles waltl]
MEDNETGRDEEVEWLHHEVLCLREQHVELQGHAKDLENRSQQNNVRIRGVPSQAEGADLSENMGPFSPHLGNLRGYRHSAGPHALGGLPKA